MQGTDFKAISFCRPRRLVSKAQLWGPGCPKWTSEPLTTLSWRQASQWSVSSTARTREPARQGWQPTEQEGRSGQTSCLSPAQTGRDDRAASTHSLSAYNSSFKNLTLPLQSVFGGTTYHYHHHPLFSRKQQHYVFCKVPQYFSLAQTKMHARHIPVVVVEDAVFAHRNSMIKIATPALRQLQQAPTTKMPDDTSLFSNHPFNII